MTYLSIQNIAIPTMLIYMLGFFQNKTKRNLSPIIQQKGLSLLVVHPFTQLLVKELTPLFHVEIEIYGRSEQILRETRMPAIVLRIGPTEDLVAIAPQLSIALKEAVFSWFSQPFDENPV